MTVWAILSDVHGRSDRLARVLADADRQAATHYLSLGDVGSVRALEMLDEVGATCVFGNWEASGLRGLPQPYRRQVARWPAFLRMDGLSAAHASPVWPAGLAISRVVDYLRSNDTHWLALFPRLHRSDDARWAAFAELEAADQAIFFHGHTHIQEVWRRTTDASLTQLPGPFFAAPSDGSRMLVGVGSVGDPRDGNGACYALYDDQTRMVTWRRV